MLKQGHLTAFLYMKQLSVKIHKGTSPSMWHAEEMMYSSGYTILREGRFGF